MSLFPDFHVLMSVQNRVTDCDITLSLSLSLSLFLGNKLSLPAIIDQPSFRFCKSIIKSRGELSYEQAQQRIDDPNMQDNMTNSLRNLNMLAKQLKMKRIDAG